jgi:hypothetical protein
MPFYPPALDLATNAVAAAATRVRMHTGDPGAAGAANVGTGGFLPCAWTGSSAGEAVLTEAVSFSGLAANEPTTWFTVWNTATDVCYGKGQILDGDVAANAAGEFTLAAGTKLKFA